MSGVHRPDSANNIGYRSLSYELAWNSCINRVRGYNELNIEKEALQVAVSKPITVDFAEFQADPKAVFDLAEREKSVVHVMDSEKIASVVMSQAQYAFALDEIESLYDVIDELTVNDDLANSDEKTYSVSDAAFERIRDWKPDEGWD